MPVFSTLPHLRHPHVSKLDIQPIIQENIKGLDVTVQNFPRVHVVQAQQNLQQHAAYEA